MKTFSLTQQLGLSLVELMVSVALGAFLSVGVVQLYVSHRLTVNNTEGVSQMQDNVRYALRLMTYQARMAGYSGCMSKDRDLVEDPDPDGKYDGSIELTNLLNNPESASFNFRDAITGYDNIPATVPAELESALVSDPRPAEGTDVVIFRGAGDTHVPIVDNNNGAQFFAGLTSTGPDVCDDGDFELSGLCKGDVVLASDCDKAVIFQITNLTSTSGNTQLNVVHSQSGSYSPGNSQASWGGNGRGAEKIGEGGNIIKMETNFYYVGDNNGRPALYRKVNANAAEVMAENIIDMQVEYGENTDSSGDTTNEVNAYRTANNVVDWDEVLSVRINLLVASNNDNLVGDGNSNDRMSFEFYGQDYVAADRRLYQTVTASAVLRNRAD